MSEFFNTPDVSGTEQTQGNEASGSSSAPSTNTHIPAPPQTQAEIIALDKLERFKFGDKEYTPDQLRKERMLHQDYTKKTQALSKVKSYYDSLQIDLDDVKANPHLADKFREVYPKEFHKFLDYVIRQEERAQAAQENGQNVPSRSEIPQEIQNKISRFEAYVHEQETAKYEAQLDTRIARLSSKYPEGNEELVLARAQAYLDNSPQGTQISEAQWEKMWKQSHDQAIERDKKRQEALFNKQKSANNAAKDMAPGGQAVGSAPQKIRLKDVADQILQTRK